MATLDELHDALRNADAAGDTEAAQQLADAIVAMQPKKQESAPYNGTMTTKDKLLQLASGSARGLGLAGRTIINAATSLPLAAADFGIGARNLVTGERNPSASDMWNQSLDDAGLVKAESIGEKISDIAGQALLGAKMPSPQGIGTLKSAFTGAPAELAPTAFGTQAAARLKALKDAQKAGYVVPPSTTNPSIINKTLESIGGKVATEQDARAANSEITKRLAQRVLGLHPDQPVTKEAVKAVIADQSPAYEAVKQIGTITADAKYADALKTVVSRYEKVAAAFPGLAKDDITKLVSSMDQPSFDSESAIEATKLLRENADDAFRSGNSQLGKAARSI